MGSLFFLMAERIGLLLILAFLLVNVPVFRKLLAQRNGWLTQIVLVGMFSIFVIVANLTGIRIGSHGDIAEYTAGVILHTHGSMANTRTLGISVAGLIGGPFVGTAVGFIGGVFRVIQGNFSDGFYIVSSSVIGLISGVFGRKYVKSQRFPGVIETTVIGALIEIIQLIFVYFFATGGPAVVAQIAFPMIFWNSLGSVMFISIIHTYLNREIQLRAGQTRDVLNLMEATLPSFRAGLSNQTATEIAKLIIEYTKFVGVELQSNDGIWITQGQTSSDQKRIITSTLKVAQAPVTEMKFYSAEAITNVQKELVQGMSSIFSTQLAFGQIEQQNQLLKDEEIKALQAQINPHFFFNAINTILAIMRHDVEQARGLLLDLSTYFRSTLTGTRETKITIDQELTYTNAYLALEMTRFPDRYDVKFEITTNKQALILPFMLQILVENAIKHGFENSKTNNLVVVKVRDADDQLIVNVIDNGQGIEPELLGRLGKVAVESAHGSGTALENLNHRLIGLYGHRGLMNIKSNENGTDVEIRLPFDVQK